MAHKSFITEAAKDYRLRSTPRKPVSPAGQRSVQYWSL